MKLIEIHRYPVKSMGGHTLSATDIGEQGIPGDRAWAVRDEARGSIKAGKRFPALMAMHASFETESGDTLSPPVSITLPNDEVVHSSDADIHQRLTEAVGTEVTLWPLVPKEQIEHYKSKPNTSSEKPEAALRQLFARTPDEPLPDLSEFPKELFEYESPPGTYFDAFPILLMTTGSLQAMQEKSSGSNYDLRRFRPNLVVDLPGDFPENEWVGKNLKIGSVVLEVAMACPRCVMTTHGFRDLAKDPNVMRELVQNNSGNLGVYCNVVQPGTVNLGDLAELI